jgi:P-type Cu+ transporter
MLASGDHLDAVSRAAATLGLPASAVHAGMSPAAKLQLIAAQKSSGRHVAMVGDGINDAPALAAADLGIAVASGTDLAGAAAHVRLLHSGVALLPTVFALARKARRTIRQNLAWAFAFNVIGIAVACGLFVSSFGWRLSPMFASAAMSSSSVAVLFNSLWLRRWQPTKVAV